MNHFKKSLTGLLCFLSCVITPVAVSQAAELISLNGPEMQRVFDGELVVREVDTDERNKNGRTFEAIGLMDVPAQTLENVLTEYEHYPEFMPNVSRLDVVERDNEQAILDYTLSLPLGKTKRYRLRLTRSAPDGQTNLIRWQLRPRPDLQPDETIKDTSGYWCIRETAGHQCLVLYHVYTDPGPIPLGLGWIADFLSEKSIPQVFRQTKARAEGLPGPH